MNSKKKWIRESDEVFFCSNMLEFVDQDVVASLKEKARETPRRRARLCLHVDPDQALHQMLIVHPADAYVRPHMHLSRDETFQIVEGRATLFIFDEKGRWREQTMGQIESGKPFMTLIPKGVFHAIRIESPVLVFLESTCGPFNKADLVEAPWSPESSDKENVEAFLEKLRDRNDRN